MKFPKEKLKELLIGGIKTPNENILRYDDCDSRKSMARALEVLSDKGRLDFLNWCCRLQKEVPQLKVGPNFSPTIGFGGRRDPVFYPVVEAINDISMLTFQFHISAAVILRELERRARRVR